MARGQPDHEGELGAPRCSLKAVKALEIFSVYRQEKKMRRWIGNSENNELMEKINGKKLYKVLWREYLMEKINQWTNTIKYIWTKLNKQK